jgi:hypothetical protein
VGERSRMFPSGSGKLARGMRGLRTKSPLILGAQGFLAGVFLVAIVTQGDWAAAVEVGVGIGIVCLLIGVVYRAVSGQGHE